jgi:hypothetical protein
MIVPVKKWPFPGSVIPVQVDRANPQNVKILFDKIQSHAESSKASADALAAMMRGETPTTGDQADWAAAGIPPDKAESSPRSSRCSRERASKSPARAQQCHRRTQAARGTRPRERTTPRPTRDRRPARGARTLARLHESGALTDAEFAAEKRRILDS